MSDGSYSTKMYNSDGRIIQIDYAMKSVNLGTTTMGIKLKEGVVIISEKKITSKLQDASTIHKQYKIYDNIVAGISGISGDAPTIIRKCWEACVNHERIFNECISVEKLMRIICKLALQFSEDDLSKRIFTRPFGVSLLLGVFDGESKLYSIDPSGSYCAFKSRAIGATHEILENELESIYDEEMGIEECIKKSVRILKNVMKDTVTCDNIEISLVNDKGVKLFTSEEIGSYLN